MDKNQVLSSISQLVTQNLLSKEELLKAYEKGQENKPHDVLNRKIGVAESMYYIGGLIVFIGIAVLIFQNWESLNTFTRIGATLGSGIAAYIVGVLLGTNKNTDPVGYAFHLISALVTPLGLFISLDAAGADPGTPGYLSLIFGTLFVCYLISYLLLNKLIFIIFTIIFGAIFYFTFTNYLFSSNPIIWQWHFNEYRVLALGIAFILLGFSFTGTDKKGLSETLYSAGTLGILGSVFALGGWTPNQNIFWEIIFPGLALGSIFSTFYFNSRSFMLWGTLFLMAYILKITAEYFANSLGWPLALVLAGLSLIVIGFLAFKLNSTFNHPTTSAN